MKLRTIAMAGVMGVAGLGLIGSGADAVFTAYSLVLKEAGKVIQVDEAWHQPIVQKLGILARTQHSDDAQKFTRFVLGESGRAILMRYGYKIH